MTVEEEEEGINVEKVVIRTTARYLNYYHFRTNLKRMSGKQRIPCTHLESEESFPLSFIIFGRKTMIIDPARGRYCDHHAFTDLRLYYLNFNSQTNLYSCPIQGCNQKMTDADIIYLKEVVVLVDYAKHKCENWPELAE